MKRKISKSKTSKSKTTRRRKSKVVRRAKPKVTRSAKAKKVVRRRECPLSSVTYTKVRRFTSSQPSDITCMRLAEEFARQKRAYHSKHFCKLGYCRPGVKCTTIIYYCYQFTAQGNGGRLLMTARGLCKCMAATNPPTYGLIIYNCSKAK